MNDLNLIQTCDQCGLPYGKGGVLTRQDKRTLHFCCYGCSFTYSLTGEKGDAGAAGLFLARLGFAAFLSMNIMALSWMIYDQGWATFGIEPEIVPYLEKLLFVLSLPIMLFVGYPYIRNGVREARFHRFSMDSLIALGSFVAFGFSTHQVFTGGRGIYFDTATTTLVLVTAGRYLEAVAKVRTSNAIKKLIDLQPDTARVLRDNRESIIPAEQVQVGESIKVLPGERVPLDGVLVEGTTSVNESLLTGESVPAVKKLGDSLYAATVNIDGAIVVRVTAAQKETVHAQTVRLMEEAQRSRSPIQQSVDKISAIFIPLVIGIALLTLIGWMMVVSFDQTLLHALTVLVVACPCALGIGTPLASAIGIGRAAERGILIRSTAVLERLANTKIVAFDKTGTLTKGELSVATVWSKGDEQELLDHLLSVEKNSEHVLSKAIVQYAGFRGIRSLEARNVVALPGLGIQGEVRDNGEWRKVIVGSDELMKGEGIELNTLQVKSSTASGDQPLKDQTMFYISWNGAVQGYVGMKDTLRSNAKDIVESLHSKGIKTCLLSGDSNDVTHSVARSLGIQEAHGRLLPKDKLEKIHSLQSQTTLVMVGDGINDAPSLAAADVGVTLGSATDIAKESADVTIVGDHLEKIPWLIDFAKKTLSTIRWNLFWAFGYNALGIAVAVAGLLEPILAAFAMVISSLFIIVNSSKLMRWGKSAA